MAELEELFLHLDILVVIVYHSVIIGVSGGATQIFSTDHDVAVFVLGSSTPAVASATVTFSFIIIFAKVERTTQGEFLHHGMHIQTAHKVLAVVVVKLVGTIAVEQTDVIGDQRIIFAFQLKEFTGCHDTEVAAKATDTANVFVSN